jgi:tetratricopeptide (TPR) repeat protein
MTEIVNWLSSTVRTISGQMRRAAAFRAGEARARGNLGLVEARLSRYQSATGHFEQALTLWRQPGNRDGEARALNGLGGVEARLGRHQAAADHYEQALAIARETGDRTGEANALNWDLQQKLMKVSSCTPHRVGQEFIDLVREMT